MSEGEKIRVLIADDHGLFREMLYHALMDEPDIEVVGQAFDGCDAIEKTAKLKPEILLMDISMPRMDGIEATEIIKKNNPDVKIVILTALDEEEFIFKLIQAGAIGYLMKDTSSSEVISAIRAAHSGESLIQPKVARKVIKELSRLLCGRETPDEKKNRQEKEKMLKSLTEREMEVLKLVGQGLNNREIANELYISNATVKTHVMNTMHKLHLRDRVEMVLFAIQAGLIDL